MGKITVKHFLNTNLKPYVINKQNYYSIYVFVTANRKTTKLKSIMLIVFSIQTKKKILE